MITLRGQGVNQLYTEGLSYLRTEGLRENSRNGPVIVSPVPVMSVYEKPDERVLLDPRRDANPFFHLFESLWMLSGDEKASPLNHYIKDFGERFAETDGVIHGAYGDRWRSALGFDQLNAIVDRLSNNHSDRQCVLQMWDAREVMGSNDLMGDWRDRPCNTHIYFRVRELEMGGGDNYDPVLDMTVCCRSNDILWGAYGANAVHFSMLQEYMAGRIGINLGTMYQLSNNFHAYVDMLDKIGKPNPITADVHHVPIPIGDDWVNWDADLSTFMAWHDYLWDEPSDSNDIDTPDGISNDWFHTVAGPMCQVYWLWKRDRKKEALAHVLHVEAPDWHAAAELWMRRRIK